MLDREVVGGRVAEGILWQPGPIAAHVRSAQVQDAHIETLDAANLSFDIGDCGHETAFGKQSNPIGGQSEAGRRT